MPTRGFALQDVVPYSVFDETPKTFRTRVLTANRSWKRYADDVGFATLLASETPWEERCGDVLSTARAIDGGQLMATDLPWLVAGKRGARNILYPCLGDGDVIFDANAAELV